MISNKGKCSPRPPRGGNKDRPSRISATCSSVDLNGDGRQCVAATRNLPVMNTEVKYMKSVALDPLLSAEWKEGCRKMKIRERAIKSEFPDVKVGYVEDFDPEVGVASCGKCRKVITDAYHHFVHRNEVKGCVGYVSFCGSCRGFFKGERGLAIHRQRSVCGSEYAVGSKPAGRRCIEDLEEVVKLKELDGLEEVRAEVPNLNLEDGVRLKEVRVEVEMLSVDFKTSLRGKCSVCSKIFKGKIGLKLHHSKSMCGEVITTQVSSASQLSNRCSLERKYPEVLPSRDINHRATADLPDNCESEQSTLVRLPARRPINWPRMVDDARWLELDKLVVDQLPPDLFPVEKKLNMLEVVLYEEAESLFGCIDRKGRVVFESRRQVKMRTIRKQIKELIRQIRCSDVEEVKSGLLCVIDDLKVKRRDLRRAETKRKRKWKRSRWRREFYKDPFKTAKNVLDPKVKCALMVGKEVLDKYVQDVASDPHRNLELIALEGIEGTREPTKEYYLGKLCYGKFQFMLGKKRNKSRPGPNQLPYKIYKKCPRLQQYLFSIISSTYSCGKVPLSWRISDGIFIPKVEIPNANVITDFRQIALMNCEGKLWWSMISDGLYKYLVTDNGFIDTKIQKGSIKNTPGCWEHTSMMWSALKHCKTNNKSLAALWLDLANAYGSVPHQLIIFALRRYRVPEKIIGLVIKYYWGLWGRSSSHAASSDWFQYEVGVFAGCTLSVILFLLAFNVVVEYLKYGGTARFVLPGDLEIEPFRAFMDDLSILTPSVLETERALRRTDTVLKWARMKLKAQKSRSVVISSGKPLSVAPFSVDGCPIPSLQEKPLKTLGRFYDSTISDEKSRDELKDKLLGGLRAIDKSHLSGFMKVWTLQHLLLPKVQWSLMLYEISLSWVERLEMTVSRYIRKWMGVSRNLTGVALYSKDVPCPFKISRLSTVFKTTKTNAYLQLAQSKDAQVKFGAAEVRTGRKWTASSAAKGAEDRLWQDELMGLVPEGRSGFGWKRKWKKGDLRGLAERRSNVATTVKGFRAQWQDCVQSKGRAYRQGVIAKLRLEEGERLMVTALQQNLQGQWTRWKDVVQRDFGWKSLLSMKPSLVRFSVGATYDTLASPANLRRWGMVDDPSCVLCGVPQCTVAHVLSGCDTSLQQGRFTYRHDSVLRVLADGIVRYIRVGNSKTKVSAREIVFVKEGEKAEGRSRKTVKVGILDAASDWEFLVDLNQRLVFPQDIVDTALRPDIVIVSRAKRSLVIIELTCPCEENFDDRHRNKLEKYFDLVSASKEKGWKVDLFAVEVGARGYSCNSLGSCFRNLGMSNVESKKLSRNAADAALRASFWIWLCRETKAWGQSPVLPKFPKGPASSTLPLSNDKDGRGRVVSPRIKFTRGSNLELDVVSCTVAGQPTGLKNIGNTCYMNSVLQCVFTALEFSEAGWSGLMLALCKLCKSWRRAGEAISPSAFWRTFTGSNSDFKDMVPHDAHEFLISLLSDVSVSDLLDQVVASSISTRRCIVCAAETMCRERMIVWNLHFRSGGTVQDMVDVSEEDSLVAEYECSACGQANVTTNERVDESKDVLLVALQRFVVGVDGVVRKDETEVRVPLGQIVVNGKGRTPTGIVVHQGSRQSGHYVAVVNVNGSWFECSDSCVTKVGERRAEFLASKGYIFFFK